MSEELVLVNTPQPGLAVLTLNRPHAMNALSKGLCKTFSGIVDRLEADPVVRVLIVTGAGRGFCAGLDLKELAAYSNVGDFIQANDPVRALSRFSGPIIGAINGVAITGGFELALACDVLIASTEARFADTHARVGIIPGWGLSQKLSRIVGPSRAKEMAFTGNFINAQEAAAMGLVNRVLPPAQLLDEARRLAGDMLSALPDMLPAYKVLIDEGYRSSFGDGLALEQERTTAWSAEMKEGDIARRRESVLARGRGQGRIAPEEA
ncbi:enoyl-CoA hydratase [Noviherbaspirillum sp. ST9]|uniref:enoyl-CoA hydratase n=1 Tax=Noviherbaspirillum sp. ST9 TaxID=3401606 RepID=UPI003B58677A